MVNSTSSAMATTPRDATASLSATGSIAASLALLAEQTPSRRVRVALRRASEDLCEGRDVDAVIHSLPRQTAALVRAGCDHGCLHALLNAELEQVAVEAARVRLAKSILAYSACTFVLIVLAMVPLTLFGWSYFIPWGLAIEEQLWWYEKDEGIKTSFYVLFGHTVLVGVATLLTLALLVVAIWHAMSRWTAPSAWLAWIVGGARRGQACEAVIRQLCVFLDHDRPLPEAFLAIRESARSKQASHIASRAEALARAGGDPLTAFPLTKHPLRTWSVSLDANDLRSTAQLLGISIDGDIERAARITQVVLVIITAVLLLGFFFVMTAPSITALEYLR